MTMLKELLAAFIAIIQILNVSGHGRLVDPPSRASMWRYGFNTAPDYNDNQGFCGGKEHQIQNGGKCGICGDPWDAETKNHEAGGKFASGIIVKSYDVGQTVTVQVELTANHKGYFEFRLCVNNDVNKKATHDCLDENILQLADGSGTKYFVDSQSGNKHVAVQLPENVVCTQCVFQWKYHVANSWGMCEDGIGRNGCGPQEEFYACSDIAITGDDDSDSNRPGTTTPKPVDVTTGAPTTISPVLTTAASNNGPCHAIGGFVNVPNMHTWCVNNCAMGNCPSNMCRCGAVDAITAPKTVPTTVPLINDLCHAIGVFTDIAHMDVWCVNNCAVGDCPPNMCNCDPDVDDFAPTVECLSFGDYKSSDNDHWCKMNCQLGNCPSSHCKCAN